MRSPAFAIVVALCATIVRVSEPQALTGWLEGGRPTPAALLMISTLRGAEAHGLSASDYDATQLEAWAVRLTSVAPAPGDGSAFEAALSAAARRYLSDLHGGRVDRRWLGFDFHAGGEEHDHDARLRAALAEGRLADELQRAAPALAQYARLVAVLARYRALAASEWPGPLKAVKKREEGGVYADRDRLVRVLLALGDLAEVPPEGDVYDAPLAAAVRRFQARHGLEPDGILGPATFRQLNVAPSQRVRQIELAMERLRWLPHLSSRFVVVNVPAFRLLAFGDAADPRPALQTSVIVGRAVRTPTPLFAAQIRSVLFQPPWYPPESILRRELLPQVERNPGWLAENEMEVVDAATDRPRSDADAEATLRGLQLGVLRLRQRPGALNALGPIKFEMPNPYGVYLHGTPARSLFGRSRRDLSHGCVRAEDPGRLAEFLLAPDPTWTRERIDEAMQDERTLRVVLRAPVPILVYYTTTVVRADGTVEFFEDIYREDTRLERALATRRRLASWAQACCR